MIVLEDTPSPSFEDVIEVLFWLQSLKYPTSDLHNEIAGRMTVIATKHFDRASKLCSIESDKGKKTPEQLSLIEKTIKTFNQE